MFALCMAMRIPYIEIPKSFCPARSASSKHSSKGRPCALTLGSRSHEVRASEYHIFKILQIGHCDFVYLRADRSLGPMMTQGCFYEKNIHQTWANDDWTSKPVPSHTAHRGTARPVPLNFYMMMRMEGVG